MAASGYDSLESIVYGSLCIWETAKYESLAKGIAADIGDALALDEIHELIMLLIKRDRQCMYNALEADFERDVPRSNHSGFTLSYRYGNQIRLKIQRQIPKLVEGAA